MSSQVIEGWKPIRGVPGKTIVTQNSDGSYTVTIDPSAIGDGSGDMLRAVYDTNDNNIVDAAESVPWAGITDVPVSFPPDAHDHDSDYSAIGHDHDSDYSAIGHGHDHDELGGLADDDHPQYTKGDGRPTGQTIIGGTASGDDLTLTSTSNATKGDVIVSDPLLLSGATATRLLATDANKRAVSVGNLASWVGGTSNQVTVTDDGDGTVTLSAPQDLHTSATPTFAGVVAAYVAPASDGTTAFQVRKADKSTAVLTVDTTNSRVGIGVTPTNALHVGVNSNAFLSVIKMQNSNDGKSAGIELTVANDNASFGIGILSSTSDAWPGYGLAGDAYFRSSLNAGNLNFITANASALIRFFSGVNANGPPTVVFSLQNVGIGTSSPSRKLHVVGTILVDGDEGGIAGTIGLTDVSDATLSTGAGSVKLKGTTARDNTGFIKVYVGTSAVWLPYWSNIS